MMMLSPPALVAALQRLAHDLDVADALERVVHATVGHVDDGIGHIVDLGRVDEVGHAELLGQGAFAGIDIDPDDAVRTHQSARPG